MAENEVIYSEIPMRTWRWLGVNEARVPAAVTAAEPQERHITVPAGEKAETVVVYRAEGAAKIKVELGEAPSSTSSASSWPPTQRRTPIPSRRMSPRAPFSAARQSKQARRYRRQSWRSISTGKKASPT